MRDARIAIACAVTGSLLASCGDLRTTVDRASLARQEDAYVRVVLALGARDPDSLDFYAGPDAGLRLARTTLAPLSDIRAGAQEAFADIARTRSHSPVASSRRVFLTDQLGALVARVDLLAGRRFSFDEESRRLFGVDPGMRDTARFTAIRGEIARLLPGSTPLAERLNEMERRFLVPADRLPAVIARAVEECRQATIANLMLPADERVDVEFVRGLPWSAFTRYEGNGHSRTRVNLDFAFPVDRVLDLACHETYPGHHTINVLLDSRVQLLFSPQSLRTEGAASFAPALAFPLERRLAVERDILMPAAGLDTREAELYVRVSALADELRWVQTAIARRYLDGQLEFERAAEALEEQVLMSRVAAESTLKFVNEFRTYIVTYTVGRDLVRDRLQAVPDGPARWQAYERWFRP